MASKLSNAYVDPSQPGSLAGINAFAKAQGISRAEAQRQLQQLFSISPDVDVFLPWYLL